METKDYFILCSDSGKKTTKLQRFKTKQKKLADLEDFHRARCSKRGFNRKSYLTTKNSKRLDHGFFLKVTRGRSSNVSSTHRSHLNDDIFNGQNRKKQGYKQQFFSYGNDAHVDDADIRPIYNEEPMAEVQTTDDNVSATGQQHTEHTGIQLMEEWDDQNAEQCHDIRPLPAILTDNMTTKLSYQSLESENISQKTEASRNFDLMIIKWCLLKITLQAIVPQCSIDVLNNAVQSVIACKWTT
ncbi:hypothetical protein Tco_0369741 [Tanacetum coccineum]|uniref:Uncharacterized protein n=1 Tax=Tanacetum coccineum TaxID=301880 RepID=A0ABQ5EPX8_9ASTR